MVTCHPSPQLRPLATFLSLLGLVSMLWGCSPDNSVSSGCGDGTCDSGESPANCSADCPVICGDTHCTAPQENALNCPLDCLVECAVLADITENLQTGEPFFGYPLPGLYSTPPSCGNIVGGKTLSLSFTADFTGDLTLSTDHPSTTAPTIMEVRESTCDGSPLACFDGSELPSSTLTTAIVAGHTYVVAVTVAQADPGVFALSLKSPGVCTGDGLITDLNPDLLTGLQYSTDTSLSTSSLEGSCGGEGSPESLFTFTAPRAGIMTATTAHPNTAVNTTLYASPDNGQSSCGTASAELACGSGSVTGTGAEITFTVAQGADYNLFLDGNGPGAGGPATLTLGYLALSPYTDSLRGCSHSTTIDRYALFAFGGEEIHAAVDTVDTATAADTRLMIRHPDGTELYEADDEVECSYPPPSYSCPDHTFTAPADGLYVLEVYVGSSEACADHSLVNYRLSVTVDDSDADLIHFGDL